MEQDTQSETSEPQYYLQDLSAEWVKFPIEDVEEAPDSIVLMDDYLIILTFGRVLDDEEEEDDNEEDNDYYHQSELESKKYSACLLAVDLRDLSVQQAQIEEWDFEGFSSDADEPNYTLLKYNENQIIAFDGNCCAQMIIIESFQPLSFKHECMDLGKKIKSNDVKLYKDCLYVLKTDSWRSLKTPWCYDLQNKTWKACETVGECPGPQKEAKSFVFKDNLYVYGGKNNYGREKDIFMLNFDTMEWKKIQQKEGYFEEMSFSGEIYKEHMVLLVSYEGFYVHLRCWNINSNSWIIFIIKQPDLSHALKKVIVYKNSLWVVQEAYEGGICLQTYNLDNLGLEAPISPEEQRIQALFMNENESDVKLKVQDQIIPAHKEVLINKSRFFAGLFKSGMAETKQDVIEIKDCDFVIFQEFLRFIYFNEFSFDDELLAFDLLEFADKHIQNDLVERCFDYLKSNINSKTIFKIFEEAHARNLQNLIPWCIDRLENNITVDNISEIAQSLILKPNIYPSELRYQVFDWILENFLKIYHKQNQSLRPCEEFLAKNIKIDNIVKISKFLAREIERKSVKITPWITTWHSSRLEFQGDRDDELEEEERKILEQETIKFRNEVYCFMRDNWKEIGQGKIVHDLPKKILGEMISFMVEASNQK